MEFLITLAVTLAVVLAAHSLIKKHPLVVYAFALVLDALFIASLFFDMPRLVWEGLFLLVQKCTLALALFVIVMFIGAFPRDSKLAVMLRPIRAELSIAACYLALGHMALYLKAYLPRVVSGGVLGTSVASSFAVALVLFALLLILGITSFGFVKRRMSTESWKRLQKLAYVFFALIYVHLVLMLLPPAMSGSPAAMLDVAVYTLVFGAYVVLRVSRWRMDLKAGSLA